MDHVHVVRHKVLVEGRSQRQTARDLGLSRNTVAKYLHVSAPTRVEKQSRPKPVTNRIASRIDELLKEWRLRTTPKQRQNGHAPPSPTARRRLSRERHDGAPLPQREATPECGGLHPVGLPPR